ncbi:hypothetical protein MLD38_036581 [Melastoma candidum]|uniref:Uncharacterized protein n=1 Tax=Melastoma candidum TaxID=119954 RepID=A0ACB9LKB8_9MYRT|nr:hypothetical protein MLD38_036581 [Melastoma candidum]
MSKKKILSPSIRRHPCHVQSRLIALINVASSKFSSIFSLQKEGAFGALVLTQTRNTTTKRIDDRHPVQGGNNAAPCNLCTRAQAGPRALSACEAVSGSPRIRARSPKAQSDRHYGSNAGRYGKGPQVGPSLDSQTGLRGVSPTTRRWRAKGCVKASLVNFGEGSKEWLE